MTVIGKLGKLFVVVCVKDLAIVVITQVHNAKSDRSSKCMNAKTMT